MSIPVIKGYVDWVCAAGCGATSRTEEVRPHSQLHPCPKMGGLMTPMVTEGTKVKVELHEREDYLNGDEGQPMVGRKAIMAMKMTRDYGEDVRVFAPTARIRGEAGGS